MQLIKRLNCFNGLNSPKAEKFVNKIVRYFYSADELCASINSAPKAFDTCISVAHKYLFCITNHYAF